MNFARKENSLVQVGELSTQAQRGAGSIPREGIFSKNNFFENFYTLFFEIGYLVTFFSELAISSLFFQNWLFGHFFFRIGYLVTFFSKLAIWSLFFRNWLFGHFFKKNWLFLHFFFQHWLFGHFLFSELAIWSLF